MAIVITLRGFNDVGRSVTPIFLLLGRFLYRFSTFWEKMKKIYRVEVLTSWPWFNCAAVTNASLRVKVCENDGNI